MTCAKRHRFLWGVMANSSFNFKLAKQVLLEWHQSRRPLDNIVNETLREHHVGSSEREAVGELVYSFIRYWPQCLGASWLEANFFEKTPHVREFDEALQRVQKKGKDFLRSEHIKGEVGGDARAKDYLVKYHGLPHFLQREVFSFLHT